MLEAVPRCSAQVHMSFGREAGVLRAHCRCACKSTWLVSLMPHIGSVQQHQLTCLCVSQPGPLAQRHTMHSNRDCRFCWPTLCGIRQRIDGTCACSVQHTRLKSAADEYIVLCGAVHALPAVSGNSKHECTPLHHHLWLLPLRSQLLL